MNEQADGWIDGWMMIHMHEYQLTRTAPAFDENLRERELLEWKITQRAIIDEIKIDCAINESMKVECMRETSNLRCWGNGN
jgi:hypothetical protein